MKKKLLVLGIGSSQTPLLKEISKFKFHVTGVDAKLYNPNNIFLDDFIKCSITDYKKILTLIKHKPDFIITNSFSYGMYTLCYLNEKFKLRGPNLSDYKILNDKSIQKHLMKKNKFLIPEDYKSESFFIEKATFGKGLSWIDKKNLNTYKEKYIPGKVLCFRFAIINRKVIFIDVSRLYHKENSLIHFEERFGLKINKKHIQYATNIANTFNNNLCTDNLAYLKIDLILNNKLLYFIEAESQFAPKDFFILSIIYGINFDNIAIKILTEPAKAILKKSKKEFKNGGYKFIYKKKNIKNAIYFKNKNHFGIGYKLYFNRSL